MRIRKRRAASTGTSTPTVLPARRPSPMVRRAHPDPQGERATRTSGDPVLCAAEGRPARVREAQGARRRRLHQDAKGVAKGAGDCAAARARGGLPDGRLDRDRQGRRRLLDFKLAFNPEEHMVAPQLRSLDVLVFRADLIHRTADTKCNRSDRRTSSPTPTSATSATSTAGTSSRSWGAESRDAPQAVPVARVLGARLGARFCLRTVRNFHDQTSSTCAFPLPLAGQNVRAGA